jgi:hypothetical protein
MASEMGGRKSIHSDPKDLPCSKCNKPVGTDGLKFKEFGGRNYSDICHNCATDIRLAHTYRKRLKCVDAPHSKGSPHCQACANSAIECVRSDPGVCDVCRWYGSECMCDDD